MSRERAGGPLDEARELLNRWGRRPGQAHGARDARHVSVELPLPPARPPTPPSDRPVAVITVHGMGQQVPFQSLQEISRALAREERRLGISPEPPTITLEPIQLGERGACRATMKLSANSGPRLVHIFECYWAPLTEGQISAWATFWFLIRSGALGIWHSRLLRFGRYLFGSRRMFWLQTWTWFQFAGAIAVMSGLFFLSLAALGWLLDRVVPGTGLPPDRWWLLAQDAYAAVIGIGLTAAGVGLAWLIHRWWMRGRWYRPFPWLVIWLLWLPVLTGLMLLLLAGNLVAIHATWGGTLGLGITGVVAGATPSLHWLRANGAIVWIPIIGAAWGVSQLVRQYVGDVAVYVSSHEVNRYHETRERILEECTAIAAGVYGLGEGGQPAYDRVVLVGHSLGSVVAYDVLNRLLLDDAIGRTALDVAGRTAALVTSGSPLDKIAFLYRTQIAAGSHVLEAGASAAQPLLCHYAFRPPCWVNIHAESDWISGSIDYYDDPSAPGAPARCVVNIRDDEAFIPFMAHTQYWDTHPLPLLLHWAVREA